MIFHDKNNLDSLLQAIWRFNCKIFNYQIMLKHIFVSFLLSEARLCFYQFFGDSYPRFFVSIKDASAFISKSLLNSVVIQFSDRRKWHLECKTDIDAKKLAQAIREWRRVLENNSLIYSFSDSLREAPFNILFSQKYALYLKYTINLNLSLLYLKF